MPRLRWFADRRCARLQMVSLRKWALTLYIPTVLIVFCAIPPFVVVLQLAILDEGLNGISRLDAAYVSKLLSRFNGHELAVAFGLAEPDPGAVPTLQGCTCQLPFEFGRKSDGSMHVHHNCTSTGAPAHDSRNQPSLWCDTGPFCGRRYDRADRPHTDRDCCYDLCVDDDGNTIRPEGKWHKEAKRITQKRLAAKSDTSP